MDYSRQTCPVPELATAAALVPDSLRVVPLGGVGEIGKNLTVVEYGGRVLVVDCGVTFPTPDLIGVDLVLPDFAYLKERAADIEAIVVTHGHEDHLGALPWMLRELDIAPGIYGGRLTMAMAQSKLDEHGLRDLPVTSVQPRECVSCGPFEIETVHLTHSIPDARAVVVACDLGRVVFSGDYKFDRTPIAGVESDVSRLEELGEEGVLLLCGDSTYADRAGWSASEATTGPHLRDVFQRSMGRIVVTCFASNIHRVKQVLDVASELGRKVALVGRSIQKNVAIGRTLGHLHAPDDILISSASLDDYPDEKLIIVATGSQGEALSALRRMAEKEHPEIKLRPGDTIVFSATPIPGNEGAVNATIDRLYRLGCDVVTSRDAQIHTSGHGYAEELKLMLELLRPRYLMPVHGTHRLLRLHGELARTGGMTPERIFATSENGVALEVDAQAARHSGHEHAGAIYVDRFNLGDSKEIALHDRMQLAKNGIVIVMLAVSSSKDRLTAEPEVHQRGVPFLASRPDVLEEVRTAIKSAFNAPNEQPLTDSRVLSSVLRDEIESILYRRLRRRPLIVPVVVEV